MTFEPNVGLIAQTLPPVYSGINVDQAVHVILYVILAGSDGDHEKVLAIAGSDSQGDKVSRGAEVKCCL